MEMNSHFSVRLLIVMTETSDVEEDKRWSLKLGSVDEEGAVSLDRDISVTCTGVEPRT